MLLKGEEWFSLVVSPKTISAGISLRYSFTITQRQQIANN